MAIESDSDEVVLTYSESYYEECASEEEIYLEEIEEELRSDIDLGHAAGRLCTTRRQFTGD